MSLYWWKIINVALFKDKLYPPREFEIKENKDWGFCKAHTNREVTIGLCQKLPTREMFLATLIHEMVHQWEHETYGRMGHGTRYQTWVKRVAKELGLDIHSDIDDTDEYTYGEKLYKRRH